MKRFHNKSRTHVIIELLSQMTPEEKYTIINYQPMFHFYNKTLTALSMSDEVIFRVKARDIYRDINPEDREKYRYIIAYITHRKLLWRDEKNKPWGW